MASASTAHIIQSLIVNVLIASAKGAAALFTGSGAMLAEAIHSFADCGNQVLLLVGVTRSRRQPTAEHPLGYGRVVYFWSFMVAVLLFSAGGMFSIYEGVHKLRHPEPVQRIWLGVGILLFSLVLEGWATIGNVREINRRRGAKSFFRYIRATKDSDLIVVFGENSAAVLGLTFALAALGLAKATGDARWDAVGSLAIGLVLVAVAIFLAKEVQSLLIGESADPEIREAIDEAAKASPHVKEVLRAITIQQGPGEVLVALKLRLTDGLSTSEICDVINTFERDVHTRRPEARWIFVEPDSRD